MLNNLNINSPLYIPFEVFGNTATQKTFCKIFCKPLNKERKFRIDINALSGKQTLKCDKLSGKCNCQLFLDFDKNRNVASFISNHTPLEGYMLFRYIREHY